MFQYAFARSLSLNKNIDIKLDTSSFKSYKQRDYSLNKLSPNLPLADKNEVRWAKKKPNILDKIFNKNRPTFSYIKEQAPGTYFSELLSLPDNSYINGYFQTEKYFSSIRDTILKDFTLTEPLSPKNQEMLDNIKNSSAVSLHIRRGDYVALQDIYELCSLDYYKSAVEHMLNNVKNPHFFIFSDDIPWVEENLKINAPYTLVNINDIPRGYFDMWLMKHCKHNIIANSSFSWWGAWLNENPEKIVIAPKTWVKKDNDAFKDIIPHKWIRL